MKRKEVKPKARPAAWRINTTFALLFLTFGLVGCSIFANRSKKEDMNKGTKAESLPEKASSPVELLRTKTPIQIANPEKKLTNSPMLLFGMSSKSDLYIAQEKQRAETVAHYCEVTKEIANTLKLDVSGLSIEAQGAVAICRKTLSIIQQLCAEPITNKIQDQLVTANDALEKQYEIVRQLLRGMACAA
jgi:hypothetical protein